MRRLASALPFVMLLLLAACGAQTPRNPPAGNAATPIAYATIDADRFEQMSRQPGVVILDVRSPEEYAQGHIRGAVNIDVGAPDFTQKVAALDKNATYLVHCRSGRRSVQACDNMAGLDFSHLYNLDGGINAWTARGKPVEK